MMLIQSFYILSLFLPAFSFAQNGEPTVTEGPQFIGYYYQGGAFSERWDCRSGSTWATSSTYGRCCPTSLSNCLIGQRCAQTSVIVSGSSSTTCSGTGAQTSCVAGTVFHSLGDRQPVMNYQCWPEWNQGTWEAVRMTATPTPTASSTSMQTSASITTATQTSSSAPASTTNSPAPEPESKKSSAWIAGPVIGGVAAIAIIGGLVFWLRRRKQKTSELSGSTERMTTGMPVGHANGGAYSERYAHMQGGTEKPPGIPGAAAEMEGTTAPAVYEMGGQGVPSEIQGDVFRAELDGAPPKRK